MSVNKNEFGMLEHPARPELSRMSWTVRCTAAVSLDWTGLEAEESVHVSLPSSVLLLNETFHS